LISPSCATLLLLSQSLTVCGLAKTVLSARIHKTTHSATAAVNTPPIVHVTLPQADVAQEAIEEQIIRDDIATPVTLPDGDMVDATGIVIPITFPDGHAATITTVPGFLLAPELGNPDSTIRLQRARTLISDREMFPTPT